MKGKPKLVKITETTAFSWPVLITILSFCCGAALWIGSFQVQVSALKETSVDTIQTLKEIRSDQQEMKVDIGQIKALMGEQNGNRHRDAVDSGSSLSRPTNEDAQSIQRRIRESRIQDESNKGLLDDRGTEEDFLDRS